jgi:hypothetical protein
VGGDRLLVAGPQLVGELLGAGAEEPLDSAERVALATAVAEALLLDAASALIDRGGAELHDVERVRSGHGSDRPFRSAPSGRGRQPRSASSRRDARCVRRRPGSDPGETGPSRRPSPATAARSNATQSATTFRVDGLCRRPRRARGGSGRSPTSTPASSAAPVVGRDLRAARSRRRPDSGARDNARSACARSAGPVGRSRARRRAARRGGRGRTRPRRTTGNPSWPARTR